MLLSLFCMRRLVALTEKFRFTLTLMGPLFNVLQRVVGGCVSFVSASTCVVPLNLSLILPLTFYISALLQKQAFEGRGRRRSVCSGCSN